MTLAISINEAKINTVSVQVKTLTVSGKQVTLAVFRQIQDERLKSGDWGEPVLWGRVNYHTKDCPDGEHLHVVWQKDDQLRKADVQPPEIKMNAYYDSYDVPSSGSWIMAAVAEGWTFDGHYARHGREVRVTFGDCTVRIFKDVLPGPDYWPWVWSVGEKKDPRERDNECVREALEGLRRVCHIHELHGRFLRHKVEQELAAAKAGREAEWKRWREYLDLPHLFIAV